MLVTLIVTLFVFGLLLLVSAYLIDYGAKGGIGYIGDFLGGEGREWFGIRSPSGVLAVDAFTHESFQISMFILVFVASLTLALRFSTIEMLGWFDLSQHNYKRLKARNKVVRKIFFSGTVLILVLSQILLLFSARESVEVLSVQHLLKDVGYYHLEVDGKLDSWWHKQNLPEQFRKFQKENKNVKGSDLVVDGLLGNESKLKLYQIIYQSKIKGINQNLGICEIKTIIKNISLELESRNPGVLQQLKVREHSSIALMFSDDIPKHLRWDNYSRNGIQSIPFISSNPSTPTSNTVSHCNASYEVHCTDFLDKLLRFSKNKLSSTEEVYDKFCQYPNHKNGYIETGLVIIHSGKDLKQAEIIAEEACTRLSSIASSGVTRTNSNGFYPKINLHQSQSLNSSYLIVDTYCPTSNITIAQSEVYEGLETGYYIVVTSIKEADDPTLNEDLNRARELYQDAYITNSQVYLGCSH